MHKQQQDLTVESQSDAQAKGRSLKQLRLQMITFWTNRGAEIYQTIAWVGNAMRKGAVRMFVTEFGSHWNVIALQHENKDVGNLRSNIDYCGDSRIFRLLMLPPCPPPQ